MLSDRFKTGRGVAIYPSYIDLTRARSAKTQGEKRKISIAYYEVDTVARTRGVSPYPSTPQTGPHESAIRNRGLPDQLPPTRPACYQSPGFRQDGKGQDDEESNQSGAQPKTAPPPVPPAASGHPEPAGAGTPEYVVLVDGPVVPPSRPREPMPTAGQDYPCPRPVRERQPRTRWNHLECRIANSHNRIRSPWRTFRGVRRNRPVTPRT